MKIVLRKRVRQFKVSLVIGTITNVNGVNSALEDGNHVVMWDFDNTTAGKVSNALWVVQTSFKLPRIYVAYSNNDGGFHAYCLTRMPWLDTIAIVASTPGIDPGYVAMCAMRGHWTLRLSDKGKGAPEPAFTLPSAWPELTNIADLTSWVGYEVWSNKTVVDWGYAGL